MRAVLVRRFDRLREEASVQLGAADAGAAFFGVFRRLVADAPTKIAIGTALFDADQESPGQTKTGKEDAAFRASNELRKVVGALLRNAQEAGAVRDDVELPEVYALLVAMSRAAHRDAEVRERALTIVFDGLAPHRSL
ncbi:hypothetical protein FB565_007377 [Actinoplanes lutulentus]|nr:hypothetical protein [Actinoplanes lutulentus]MBB2947606.1 hypothetical protein [Actinoplanes lutulentus]